MAVAAGVAVASGPADDPPAEPSDDRTGFGMGGVDQQIAILAETIEDAPAPWDLSTPESAVRSYLDWVSYGYRVAESDVASQTQSASQYVRTDAYVQANLQEQRLLDQTLVSVTFGEPMIEGDTATITATEEWTYRYVSIVEAGATLEGPYPAKYETVYRLVKTEQGWVVDDIEVTTIGDVR
ncbi:MAG: hypothetical protein WBJ62_03625 [Coriobacteriia bacterium]